MSKDCLIGSALMLLALGTPLGSAAGYTIPHGVLGSGGVVMSGGSYTIHATAGQSTVGWMDGSDTIHKVGFWYVIEGVGVVAVEEMGAPVPTVYSLGQNFPNPFNPRTTVAFGLPKSGPTTLRIYDISGRVVATLVNGEMDAGMYSLGFEADELASGVYFYRLRSGDFTQTRKMLLLK